jgi:hypothetical protein
MPVNYQMRWDPADVALPLNIVLQGHSVLSGFGVNAGRAAANIAAARPTATVTDVGEPGVDVVVFRSHVTANVAPLYNAARRNIVILLDTIGYLNDRRGEAAFGGDGLTLSDPNAAAAAYYTQLLGWVADVRAAGFLALVCTCSAAYETTASPTSNNTQYQAGHAAAHTTMRANTNQFDYFADPASDSRLQTTTNATYFQADQLHLTVAGSDVLTIPILAALPT